MELIDGLDNQVLNIGLFEFQNRGICIKSTDLEQICKESFKTRDL